jgi:hypothetical protein
VTVTNKKPYTPPRLITYGHVKDIVQGATGGKADGGPNLTKQTGPPCWVAEALYGGNDPRTLILRAWLSDIYMRKDRGWWFIELYKVVGPTVASLIRRGRLPRRAFLPLFDALAGKALDCRARLILDERYRRTI